MKKILLFPLIAAMIIFTGAAIPQKYQEETVKELYSLDYPSRTYHRVTDPEDISTALEKLSVYGNNSLPRVISGGFLIKTDKGKHEVYLPRKKSSKEESELSALSQKCNAKYPANIQWFAYMDVDNIESIDFFADGGGALSLKKNVDPITMAAHITSAGSIQQVSEYLKNMKVEPARIDKMAMYTIYTEGPDTYKLDIHFKNGIHYYCVGPSVILNSSDKNEQLVYKFTSDEQLNGLRDLISQMSETKIEKKSAQNQDDWVFTSDVIGYGIGFTECGKITTSQNEINIFNYIINGLKLYYDFDEIYPAGSSSAPLVVNGLEQYDFSSHTASKQGGNNTLPFKFSWQEKQQLRALMKPVSKVNSPQYMFVSDGEIIAVGPRATQTRFSQSETEINQLVSLLLSFQKTENLAPGVDDRDHEDLYLTKPIYIYFDGPNGFSSFIVKKNFIIVEPILRVTYAISESDYQKIRELCFPYEIR